ncbi:MAG TPA: SMP-30/gluconolactonase/LRE family protein [Terracidiphilus sp.]|nr:SMP-30/gluconolactonase/LRE family protein [Terracidiphilus sp.]
MISPPSSSAPLLRKEDFATFCDGLDHPEGLAFDREGQLWAGGELGQIYRISPAGELTEVTRVGGFCLGLTFSAAQDLWVCNSGSHSLMCVDRGGRVLCSIVRVGARPLMTPNFSVFDHEGNLYFSDSGVWDGGNGCIYRMRASGAVDYFAGAFAFANGLALSADDRFLFIAESQRDCVRRIEILSNGAAGEAEVYVEGMARIPDGLGLDAEGNLYVTCYASDCIYRVKPDRSVALLAWDPEGTRIARPTNVAFGGPSFDDLYVANLGRWHIGRAHLGVAGQPLVNLI